MACNSGCVFGSAALRKPLVVMGGGAAARSGTVEVDKRGTPSRMRGVDNMIYCVDMTISRVEHCAQEEDMFYCLA